MYIIGILPYLTLPNVTRTSSYIQLAWCFMIFYDFYTRRLTREGPAFAKSDKAFLQGWEIEPFQYVPYLTYFTLPTFTPSFSILIILLQLKSKQKDTKSILLSSILLSGSSKYSNHCSPPSPLILHPAKPNLILGAHIDFCLGVNTLYYDIAICEIKRLPTVPSSTTC